jgi:P27 family predicted phage terminase small subunit
MANPPAPDAPVEFKRPPRLGAHGNKAWNAAYAQLQQEGPLKLADEFALERYARAVSVARKCWSQLGTQLTKKGSMGQPVTDPLVDSALKAEKHAADFAKALGIEPQARVVKNTGGRPSMKDAPMPGAAATGTAEAEPPVFTVLPDAPAATG